MLDRLKFHVEPLVIIMSSRCAMQGGNLYAKLKQPNTSNTGGDEYSVKTRKVSYYLY